MPLKSIKSRCFFILFLAFGGLFLIGHTYASSSVCTDFDSASYQFQGVVTSKLVDNRGIEIGTNGDLLIAVVNGQCRGFAFPVTTDLGVRFFLQTWSNTAGEVLQFQFYSGQENKTYNLEKQIIFQSNMIKGSIVSPELFEVKTFNIAGCTDINAANYNKNATSDDGSCRYAPVIDDIADQVVDVGERLTIKLSATDRDNDTLAFLATCEQGLTISVSGNELILTSATVGVFSVTVTVRDGVYNDFDAFLLTVKQGADQVNISSISDKITDEDLPVTIPFTVGGDSLTVTVGFSNVSLLNSSCLVIQGFGASKTLTVTPLPNAFGTTTVSVTVSNTKYSKNTSFLLTVKPVNDPPVIPDIADQYGEKNAVIGPIALSIVDVDTNPSMLVFSATSSNTDLLSNDKIVFGGTGFARTVTIQPVLNKLGKTTVTLNVSDGYGQATETFAVTIQESSIVSVSGHDFVKLDSNANELPETASSWIMVKDRKTGLIWEEKTLDWSVNDKRNKYSWYDSNPATNGGFAGKQGNDTEAFLRQLNDARFGGFSDWRLPTIRELSMLVELQNANPAISTVFFPNTMTGDYWTSTSNAGSSSNAWSVRFDTGDDQYYTKYTEDYVRAVRGQYIWPEMRFVDNSDGTVTDRFTGLMWQKVGASVTKTWQAAKEYCTSLKLCNYSDWRFPEREELRTIADYSKFNPAIDTGFFEDTKSAYYWSSTPYVSNTTSAWSINFYYGHDYLRNVADSYYVRAVRGGSLKSLSRIEIVKPYQGSVWDVGSLMSVTWNGLNIAGNVDIMISRSGGKPDTFDYIANSTENDGRFDWLVAAPSTVNGFIKIVPQALPEKAGTSGFFTINQGTRPILFVNPSEAFISAWSQSLDFTVSNSGTGDMSWSVVSNASWIKIEAGATGNNSGVIKLKIEQNLYGNRTGQLVVTALGAATSPKQIDIVQSSDIFSGQFENVVSAPMLADNSISHACHWIDFDNDGNFDILITRHGRMDLYRNDAIGNFIKVSSGDLTKSSEVFTGSSWADYDNDGFTDGVAVAWGKQPVFFKNAGNSSFTRILTNDAMNEILDAQAVSFEDYNSDGYLDVFVSVGGQAKNRLYSNDTTSVFRKIATGSLLYRNSSTALFSDIDNNLLPDIFAPDLSYANNLYKNAGNESFDEVVFSFDYGSIQSQCVQNACWGDYDNDGDFDLFIAQACDQTNVLLRNQGNGTFTRVVDSIIVKEVGNSKTCVWADFDNDSDLDLFVGNYGADYLYSNNGDGVFSKAISGDIVTDAANAQASAVADYNSDGNLDLYVANEQTDFLYKNKGNGNNWLSVHLVGVLSNRSAIGAIVEVKAIIDGKTVRQIREIRGQTGKNAQNSLNAHFGLKKASVVDEVKINWPSGIVQTLNNIGINQIVTVHEKIDDRPVLSVIPGFIEVSSKPGTVTLYVSNLGVGTMSWSTTVNSSWMTIASGQSGNGNGTISISYGNNSGESRIGMVSIFSGQAANSTQWVQIKQNGNNKPDISNIASVTIQEDTATQAIPFTVVDATTAAYALVVTATTSNPLLVPNTGNNIILQGTGTSRTIKLVPLPDKFGTATITLTVNDTDGQFTQSSFLLTVEPINDPPVISAVADQYVLKNTVCGPLTLTVTDAENDSINILVRSSNTTLVPDNNIRITGASNLWYLTLIPVANLTGSSNITIVANDADSSTTQRFLLTVNEIVVKPTISEISDQTIDENAKTGFIAFTVTNADGNVNELTLTVASSNKYLVPVENIKLGGIGTNRFVEITPVSNVSGLALITVSVQNRFASASSQFLLTVNDVANEPISVRFTKMDQDGKDLLDTASSWSMVRDNRTGLIWEIKTPDGFVHNKTKTYTWYNRDSSTNGGYSGTSGLDTDTEDFIYRINMEKLGGFSQWRLPTIKELAGLVDFSGTAPTIDTKYFPNTESGYYWTSDTNAGSSKDAWAVYFKTGKDNYMAKSNAFYARAVYGQVYCQDAKTVNNNDGTITDACTGLTWQVDGMKTPLTLNDAISYCDNLVLGGYSDWRVPKREELRSIVDYKKFDPAIIASSMSVQSTYYWTSDTMQNSTWALHFYYGFSDLVNPISAYSVRAVRGGQKSGNASLKVISPALGSEWNNGRLMPIRWETGNLEGNVVIMISYQGGKQNTFQNIAESVKNSGSYDWIVDGPASSNCMLKFIPLADISKEVNHGLFSILPPGIPTLALSVSTIDIPSYSENLNISVITSGIDTLAWTSESNAAWLHIYKGNTGVNTDTISFRFDPNEGLQRVGVVTVSSKTAVNSPVLLTITQAANAFSTMYSEYTKGSLEADRSEPSGVMWVDYDQDNSPELFVTNRHGVNFLYKYDAKKGFIRSDAGDSTLDSDDSIGSTWADYDNDGFTDSFVVNLGGQANRLYKNSGNGVFKKVDAIDYGNATGTPYACSWIDINLDGFIDLVVSNAGNGTNSVYINSGKGTFSALRDNAVVGVSSFFGAWADYNSDRLSDILMLPNITVYRHLANHTFEAIPEINLGLSDAYRSFVGKTAIWADYDNDGDVDVFIGCKNAPHLLLNNIGNGKFNNIVTQPMTQDDGETTSSVWCDFDNDGDSDLFVTFSNMTNVLYENLGNGDFVRISESVLTKISGLATAYADFDIDGDLDLAIAGQDAKIHIYENHTTGKNWIRIKCLGTISNRSAIGTKVLINASIKGKSVWQVREITSQAGYASQNQIEAFFGLGNASVVDTMIIEWPSGIIQTFTNVSANQFLTIEETDKSVKPILYASPSFFDVDAKSGTVEIRAGNLLTGTISWTAESLNDWLTITQKTPSSITVKYDANNSDIRTGTLKIYSADQGCTNTPQYISIRQKGNVKPLIEPINNVTITEDTKTISIPIKLSDSDTAAENLNLTITSDNQNLIPNSTLSVVGNGLSRLLNISPKLNISGVANIKIIASDGIGTSIQTFKVTVDAGNDTPIITGVNEYVGKEDTLIGPIEFTIEDLDNDMLTVSAISSNTSLVSNKNLLVSGSGQNWNLSFTPNSNQWGHTIITLTVYDSTVSVSHQISTTVLEINDTPTISDIPDKFISAESLAIAFTINDIESLPDSLTLTAHSSDLKIVRDENIKFSGTGNNRIVTIFPTPDTIGTTMITVTVNDGFVKASETFKSSVRVSDTIGVSNIGDMSIAEDTPISLTFTVAGSSSDSITVVAFSSDQSIVNNENLKISGNGITRTLSIVPLANKYGITTITLVATDGIGNATDTFALSILPVNDLPVMSDIIHQYIYEDTASQPISFTVTDADDDRLTISAKSSDLSIVPDENITWTGINGIWKLNIVPIPNMYGDTKITLTISDGKALISQQFTLSVVSQNDRPTISTILDQLTDEDTPLSPVAFTISDTETPPDELKVSIKSDPESLLADGVSFQGTGTVRLLILKPAPDQFGIANITVTVSDSSGTETEIAQSKFKLTVVAINDKPTISCPKELTLQEDMSMTVTCTINDVESLPQDLTSSAGTSNSALFPLIQTLGKSKDRTITLVPLTNLYGRATINVNVTDGISSDSASISVTVTDANDPPSFTKGADIKVSEDSGTHNFAKWATQIRTGPFNETNQSVVFVIQSNNRPDIFTVLPNITPSGDLNFTLEKNANGIADIQVLIDDQSGGLHTSPAQSFKIEVTPSNDPPTFTPGSDITVTEDCGVQTVYKWAKNIIPGPPDEFDQELTFYVSTYQQQLFIFQPLLSAADGTLTFTPAPNATGTATVYAYLKDNAGGYGASLNEVFTITITPVNDPPLITDISNQTTNEDTATSPIAFTVTDMETDAWELVLSARSSNPSLIPDENIAFSGFADHREVIITPTPNQFGRAFITIMASDGKLTSFDSFVLTVNPVNDPPVISQIANQTIDEDSLAVPLDFTISDMETPPEAMTLSSWSSNPSLFDHISIKDAQGDGAKGRRVLSVKPYPNMTGIATITISATDDDPLTATTIMAFSVHIKPINDSPYIFPISDVRIDEDTAISIPFKVTDVDTALFQLTFAIVSSNHELLPDTKENLNISLSPTGNTLWIKPLPDKKGTAQLTLSASDGNQVTNTKFELIVNSIQDKPVAADITITTLEDFPIKNRFSASDADGDALSYSFSTYPSKGNATIVSSEFTYTPHTNQTENDYFKYVATDGITISEAASVWIYITPVNDVPVANSVSVTVTEDSETRVNLSAYDADNEQLIFIIDKNGIKGNAYISDRYAGTCLYTTKPDKTGTDTFTFKVYDGISESIPATVTVYILPVNDAPQALDEVISLYEDTPVKGAFHAEDIDGDSLTYELVAHLGLGTITLNTDGTFAYTPILNKNGNDQVVFRVSDGVLLSGAANVTFSITPVNDPPVAFSSTLVTKEDTIKTGTLTSDDVDYNPLSYRVEVPAQQGTISILSNGFYTYTPKPNQNGQDRFSFVVSDSVAESEPAWVTITITPVNDAAIPQSMTFTTNEDTAFQGILKGADIDGDPMTFVILTEGTKGKVRMINSNLGEFLYSPNENANGKDFFSFVINDGTTNSLPSMVTVTIIAVNDKPQAKDGTFTVIEDTPTIGVMIAQDADNDLLAFSVNKQASKGVVTIKDPKSGIFDYMPNQNETGTDSFKFQASDNLSISDAATITITITPENDAPVIYDDSISTYEDSLKIGKLKATDPDGDSITFRIIENGRKGNVTITNRTDGTFVYYPDSNQFGEDKFSFSSTDPFGVESKVGIITVYIKPINDTPTAINATNTINEDTSLNAQLTSLDVDGDALTYSIVTMPEKGTLMLINATTGVFSYSPFLNQNGTDTFSFVVKDSVLISSEGKITLNITPVNDQPTAISNRLSTSEDTRIKANFQGKDPDNDLITFGITQPGTKGIATLINNITGEFTYTPNSDIYGTDYITFKVSDGKLVSEPSTVTITIAAINDIPVAYLSEFTIDEDKELRANLNAEDKDGDALKFSIILNSNKGTTWINNASTGAFVYSPYPNDYGKDRFVFKVNDGQADSYPVTVTIYINEINDPPIANDIRLTINEDTIGTGKLIASDADNTTLTYIIVDIPKKGILLQNDAKFSYTPAQNFFGTDEFTYRVNDGQANSNTAKVTIDINSVNDPPVANAGYGRTVLPNTLVILDGSRSIDFDDGIAFYRWIHVDGIPVKLYDETSTKPSFMSPTITTPTAWTTFQLIVYDHSRLSSTDTVTINLTQSKFTLNTLINDMLSLCDYETAMPIDIDENGVIDMKDVLAIFNALSLNKKS